MKIIGIGNTLVDVLVQLSDDALLEKLGLPRGGMQLIDDRQQAQIASLMKEHHAEMATGGSAGNAILALAHLGAHPGMIGRVGSDEMGRFFKDNCTKCGIEARLAQGPGMTGVANTFISADGERTFATHLGEAALLNSDDFSADLLQGFDLLHIEGYLVQSHELIEKVARLAKEQGMKISIDLASYNIVQADLAFFRHLVEEYVDIVFANEEESAAFTQGKTPEEALREIAAMCEVAVVKLGKRGSSAMRRESLELSVESLEKGESPIVKANSVPVPNVVDTTAAGDFFAGGFLYGYSQGWSLQQCLNAGSLLSSKVIQVIGTQVTEETWQEIVKSL